MNRWTRPPSPAMVVVLGALVMSAGGAVTAAALISSTEIGDNTIRIDDVRGETIRSRDVNNGSVRGPTSRAVRSPGHRRDYVR